MSTNKFTILNVTEMKITDAKIGPEVVRSKGDYVVGQISIIDQINFENSNIF